LFKYKHSFLESVGIGLILLGGLFIRIYRIGEPFGGFQAFNEGFYAFLAKEYFKGSLLYPKTWNGEIDYMVPPFHSYWIFFLNRLFGISEAVDRWGSVLPNLLTLYVVYLLGKKLFNKRVGLIGAGLLAFIPMNVLVGRNVQVDSTYIFFALTSLYFYLKSLETHEYRNKILSGLSLGLSLFSKQFAVLMYPSLILWETCGRNKTGFTLQNWNLKWINKKFFTFLACSLILPLPFYLYHILFNGAEFWRIQKLQGGILGLPTPSLLKLHHGEIFWGFTPLVYFLGGISLLWFLLRQRQEVETFPVLSLLLILLGIYLTFYIVTHKHSYYVLMVAPILSLLIGKFLHDQLKNPVLLSGTVILMLITLVIFSLLTLAGNKYGYKSFKDMGDYLEGIEKNGYYLLAPGYVLGAYGPVIRYYAPSGVLINGDDPSFFEEGTGELKIQESKPVYVLEPFRSLSDSPTKIFYDELWSLILWGKAIHQRPINHHFFTYDWIEVRDSEEFKIFGFSKQGELPVISIARLPKNVKIFRSRGDLVSK
jgi:4-amino-4-deoxy-L-arabinose transferase-like glycosyltransferase